MECNFEIVSDDENACNIQYCIESVNDFTLWVVVNAFIKA